VLAPPALHMMAFEDADGNDTHGNGTHYYPTVLTKCAGLPLILRFLRNGPAAPWWIQLYTGGQ